MWIILNPAYFDLNGDSSQIKKPLLTELSPMSNRFSEQYTQTICDQIWMLMVAKPDRILQVEYKQGGWTIQGIGVPAKDCGQKWLGFECYFLRMTDENNIYMIFSYKGSSIVNFLGTSKGKLDLDTSPNSLIWEEEAEEKMPSYLLNGKTFKGIVYKSNLERGQKIVFVVSSGTRAQ